MTKKRPSSALGVYLTEKSLRLTLLAVEGRSLFVDSLKYLPLPEDSLIQRLPEQKQWGDFICWFKSALGKRDLKVDQTVFSFGGGPIFVKQMPAPRGKDKDRILVELEHSLCSPSEEYVFDFYFSKQIAFAVGARRRLIDVFKALFHKADLNLNIVDAPPLALFNLAECTGLLPAKETIAVLCLEESFALLVVIQRNTLLWTENLLYPSDMVVEDSKELRVENTFAKRLCSKIQLSLNKRRRLSLHEGRIPVSFDFSRILLSGLLAEATGVKNLLSSSLKCPVDILNPFRSLSKERLRTDTSGDILPQGAFAISTGLAYRGLLG